MMIMFQFWGHPDTLKGGGDTFGQHSYNDNDDKYDGDNVS